MGRLNLALLGPPEVRHPEQLLRFPSRKALALLIYLAVEGGVQTREKLTTLFWPESDETRSKGALRRTLVYLRNTLQEEVAPSPLSHLIIERDTLVFNVASAFQMDVHALQRAFKDVCSSSRPGDLQGEARSTLLAHFQDAVEQYRADFLEGFSLDDAPDFDDWTRLQREVWHQRMSAVFDGLSQMQFEGGELPAALETARRWIRRDPLHETAYRRLMQIQFTRGERTAALQTYETCRLMLAKELRTKPAPETEALVARLRAQLLPQGETSWSLSSSAPQVAAVPSPLSLLANVPLVGRASEYGTLIEMYAAAQGGHPHVVLLKGEAGIGKTRLAQDFLGWAMAQGADVLQGRAFETGGLLPYQALVEALRSRLERENAPDDLLSDVWLTELSRILPELRERYPDLVPPAGDEPAARIRLFEAVARLGQALAERAPVVLFIDDLQWADAASLDVLHYAGRRWMESNVPMLVLVCLRAETVRPTQALATWLVGLERNLPVTSLLLGALTAGDTLHLVQGLAGDVRSQRSRETPSSGKAPWSAIGRPSPRPVEAFGSFLFAETGGQPFYVLELLKVLLERGLLAPSLQQDGRWGIDFEEVATLHGVLPSSVREVIRTRLELLTPSAFTLLTAGAVLGQNCTFELLCQVAGLGEPDGLAALEEVLTAQVLREEQQEDRRSVSTRYGFTHDKIRDVVYTETGDARRHVLHRRALDVLQARAAPAAQLAHHARAGGLLEAAFHWSLAAGDEALRLFATAMVRVHYAEALESLSHLPETAENRRQRVDIIMKQVVIASFSDPPEQSLALLAEAEALVRALPPKEGSERSARLSLARIHFWTGRIHTHRNDRLQAVHYFRQARAGAEEVEDKDLVAVASGMIGRVLATQGYCGQARPLLTQALAPLERTTNEGAAFHSAYHLNWIEYIQTLGYLGGVLAACGQYREGLLVTQRALALAQERGEFIAVALGSLHLALTYFFGGETQRVLEESRTVVRTAEQAGDWVRASIGYGLCAWAENQLGQQDAALASMAQQQALAQRLGEQRLILGDWFAATSAEVVLSAHRVEEALILAEEAVVYAHSVDGKYAEGLAQRVWGQALAALTPPRWDEVEEHLTTSLQAFEACEMLPEIARTHRTWGLLCRDRHDLASARAHLEKAVTIFEACGLTDERERMRRVVTGLN